jgi:hypothetical protein
MDNSYFIFTETGIPIGIERFHICTWEFSNNTALVEFGMEIKSESVLQKEYLDLALFVPWYNAESDERDLYLQLKDPDNSRFIFNDSIKQVIHLDPTSSNYGVIHVFSAKNELCILPVEFKNDPKNHQIKIHLDLQRYLAHIPEKNNKKANIYFRFSLAPDLLFISTRKKDLSKSTIIYDIKLNERRNLPENQSQDIGSKVFCKIENCFCFNIIPNRYNMVFFDNTALQNVRTLEYESFNKYLGDVRIQKDELIVVFNKKKNDKPFSFFSIYSKERIGTGQYALAILINFFSGILLFIPGFRKADPRLTLSNVWIHIPFEIYIAMGICVSTIVYFAWPLWRFRFKNNL